MKQVKANYVLSAIVVNEEKVFGHAVQLEGITELMHFIPSTDIKKESTYVELIKNNHPEYVFERDIVIETPKTAHAVEDTDRIAVHPHKEELANAFDMPDISFNKPPIAPGLDMETGEIKEDPATIIQEPLKEEKMETQVKVPFGKKVKWFSAKGASITTAVGLAPIHVTLQTAADVLQRSANVVRNIEASAHNALKISDNSKSEIKESIERRTRKIQKIAAMPVTFPVGLGISLVNTIKDKKLQPQPVAVAV